MTKNLRYAPTSAAIAIAASLALSSIPALAQQPPSNAPTAPAPAKPAPIVNLNVKPAPAAQTSSSAIQIDDGTLELGGGALALLALGSGAVAVSRRRRRKHEAIERERAEVAAAFAPCDPLFDDPMFRHEPAIDQRSAFAWGDAARANQPGGRQRSRESWVERAYRGPSPENPSLSLRKRLKRAAFFDKRERETATGAAAAVDATAGLPERMVEPTHDRELEAA